MKNLRKLVFLLIALLAVLALVGCGGGGNNNGTDNNTNGNGNGNTETAQWAAYQLADTVAPSSGASGKIQSFTYICTITTDGEVQQYKIEGANEGMEAVTDNGTSVTCYKVKHRVTVMKDDTGADHPDWSEMTIWIPTSLKSSDTQVFIKGAYVDSDGHQGAWSRSAASADFYMYQYYWTFYALYGWGWGYFNAFAEGGTQHLAAGSWGAGMYHYDVSKGSQTIGGYTFSTMTVEATWTAGGSTASRQGVFSPGLPLPIHLRVSGSGGGDGFEHLPGGGISFEYILTDLKLG